MGPYSQKNQDTYNYIFYQENILRDRFVKMDKNGNGSLSFAEFKAALVKSKLSNGDLEKSFGYQDANDDQRITVDEYINYVKGCNEYHMLLEEYTEMFRNLDQNNNGYLSAAEIKQDWQEKGVNLTAQGVRDVIDGFDLDEDRHISLEEYLNVLTLKHLVDTDSD